MHILGGDLGNVLVVGLFEKSKPDTTDFEMNEILFFVCLLVYSKSYSYGRTRACNWKWLSQDIIKYINTTFAHFIK